MCGIAIIAQHSHRPVERHRIEAMTAALAHRGPDASSSVVHRGVALGHTRLSIVDVAGGTQPLQTADRRFSIVFNGEIYNYRELRRRLSARGVSWRTHSDTEVILELYRHEGAAGLARLRGMFAFAIHDVVSGEVFLARDRLGLKPLFFHCDGERLVAASEMKALFASGEVAAEFNPASIANYFTYQFSVAPHTPFRDIQELPPAHFMRFAPGVMPTPVRYWDLEFPRDGEYESRAEAYWLPRFEAAMNDAVASHTTGEVPIGAYLSGGIDSCTTAALLTDHYPRNLQTFSIGFGNAAYDESAQFNEVAAHLNLQNRRLMLDDAKPERYLQNLEHAIYHLEQPQRMAVDVPHFMLSRFVRDHGYKVVYTGDGADEILAGYDCFRQDYMRVWSNGFFKRALRRRRYLKQYTQYFSEAQMRLRLELHRARRQRQTIARFGFYPAWHDFWHITRDARTPLLPPESFAAGEAQLDALTHAMQPQLRGRHLLNQSLYFESKTRLPGWILWKSDRLSMAHGIETRLPFMDHPLVELMARIPPDLKLNGLDEKYLLRRCMLARLPKRDDDYKKRGFYAPIREWFFTPGRDHAVSQYLARDALQRTGIFDAAPVERYITELRNIGTPTTPNAQYRCTQLEWTLFTVLSVQILHAQFIKHRHTAAPAQRCA